MVECSGGNRRRGPGSDDYRRVGESRQDSGREREAGAGDWGLGTRREQGFGAGSVSPSVSIDCIAKWWVHQPSQGSQGR